MRRNVERADPESIEKLSSSAIRWRRLSVHAMREPPARAGLR
jgi:hypothetical protein